jgi:hypothetical protein
LAKRTAFVPTCEAAITTCIAADVSWGHIMAAKSLLFIATMSRWYTIASLNDIGVSMSKGVRGRCLGSWRAGSLASLSALLIVLLRTRVGQI